jgi:phosphoglycerate dehydrogenase-like enzyme
MSPERAFDSKAVTVSEPGAANELTICGPDEELLRGLQKRGVNCEVVLWDGRSEPPAGLEAARVLIAGYADKTFAPSGLVRLPRLEVIQLISAGYDEWLPALPEGVVLANGRGVHGASTAELAVAGVLALVRGLPFYLSEQAAHRWSPQHRGEIAGRNVLMIGSGDIGTRIAQALEVFGAPVTLVGRKARAGVAGIESLPELLPQAEIVVLALPHTPQTDQLVDRHFLSALPDGAIVANVARGRIIDTAALVSHLRAGRISAFLDVTDPEPLPPEHPLWAMPNVIITPHVGGGTERWRERAVALIADQLERFIDHRPLINVVAPGSGD